MLFSTQVSRSRVASHCRVCLRHAHHHNAQVRGREEHLVEAHDVGMAQPPVIYQLALDIPAQGARAHVRPACPEARGRLVTLPCTLAAYVAQSLRFAALEAHASMRSVSPGGCGYWELLKWFRAGGFFTPNCLPQHGSTAGSCTRPPPPPLYQIYT